MPSYPKVSVIMLTHNREHLISRAIESIIRQTFKNFEFIIVNNGSSDHSGDIAEKYANNDSRLKVIHIDKSSIAKGRNTGVENALGEFITFIDDDDYAENDMLEFLYKLISDNNADISICGSNKEIDGIISPNYIYDEYLIMNNEEAVVEMLKREKYNVAMPTKMLRRKLLDQVKFVENSKYDDIWVGYKYFALSRKVVAFGQPKYYFYRHESNNSLFTTIDQLLSPSQLAEYIQAFRERTLYLSQMFPVIADFVKYSEYSWMISMCNKIISNNLTLCHTQLDYMRTILSENYDSFFESVYIKDFEKDYLEKYITCKKGGTSYKKCERFVEKGRKEP